DLSLARRVLASHSAETVVAGLLRDHLGAHPNAAGAAAQNRRDVLPEALSADASRTAAPAAEEEHKPARVESRPKPSRDESEQKREKKDKKRSRKEHKKAPDEEKA